ncbi:hypothetical protein FORC13_1354 [Bacillus cereus]|nr:hypothetical protein [Bacillus cereus]ALZ60415.1 hypothetical protein FORC13_1354 [Bacillus cereus]
MKIRFYNIRWGITKTNKAVLIRKQHTNIESTSRGDTMSQKEEYAASYEFGKTKVYVVAPEPKIQKDIDKILRAYYKAAWAIIDELQIKENIEE